MNRSSEASAILRRLATAFRPPAYSLHAIGYLGWMFPTRSCAATYAAKGDSSGTSMAMVLTRATYFSRV